MILVFNVTFIFYFLYSNACTGASQDKGKENCSNNVPTEVSAVNTVHNDQRELDNAIASVVVSIIALYNH